MSRTSGQTLAESIECVRCGASVVGADGGFVCSQCGESTADRWPQVTPCRQVTVERGDVTLTKTVFADDGGPQVKYALSSARSAPVKFRLLDTPGHRAPATGTEGAGDECAATDVVDITWWIGPDEDVEFTASLPESADGMEDVGGEPTVAVVPWLSVEGDAERPAAPTGVAVTDRPRLGESRRDGDEATADRVLVGIPAYNEGTAIRSVVAEAMEYADAVLVVDDGSTDDTARRALEAGAFVVEHVENRGYGAALQTIFEEADRVGVEHLAVVDGDGQHDPSDVTELVAEQRDGGADVVIGNRFADRSDVPLYRRIGLAAINALANLNWGRVRPEARVGDTQSGFRVYDREVIASLVADDRISDRMGASTDILNHACRHGYDIAEVPTTIEYEEGANTLNPVYHGLLVVGNLAGNAWRDHPLAVVGLPGLLVALTGLAAAVQQRGGVILDGEMAATVFVAVGLAACFTAVTIRSLTIHGS